MDHPSLPAYAELCCLSNFSFLQGASHPEELVARAHALGYSALAITDDCSMAGVVRAHVAAKAHGLKLLIGSRFEVDDDEHGRFALVLLAPTREAYGQLCAFITRLRRRSPKGTYRLARHEIDGAALPGCLAIAWPARHAPQAACDAVARGLLQHFIGRCWLGVVQRRALDDELHLHRLRESARLCAVPLVAVGDVRLHQRSRKPLHDVLTATRIGRPLTECGFALAESAEQRLRSRLLLSQRFAPDLLAETLNVAARCQFSLDELRYQYPAELVPTDQTPTSWLRQLVQQGAARRWPDGVPRECAQLIEHELALIAELRYEHYFLTVHDIVAFARSRHILCQGRGSAANSVVCFCLGITEVNPAEMSMLFERFISRERREPPDIDVDFEHARREEVVQYLYAKYGRDRAALTATVICYRPRSALRDVGKALGFDPVVLHALGKGVRWWSGGAIERERLVEVGLDPDALQVRQLVELTGELMGFPRHLSQHTGGFVLTSGPLSQLVPIQNAAMADRTVIEWDKDDLDALGLLKVDVLALGMLTAIRKTLDLIAHRLGRPFGMQDIPIGDEPTYDMVCAADTVGVFQIESRAQMSMLPRLRPRVFYDLVIEVALVRPGPIQGGAVHPYLNRRQGKVPVDYPKNLEKALQRTLGVPVFQEQCMQIAMIAAGFTPDEADGLRRAMAAWKRKGSLGQYETRLLHGMADRGYDPDFARGVVEQVKGFSSYGFPESHAASFAKLVYVSAWLKCHHPDAFLVALLNSQPMGFYNPRQLVQDARRHGVDVHPADVQYSDWEATLESSAAAGKDAVRLGLCLIDGLGEAVARRIVSARAVRPFDSVADLARRGQLARHELERLAAADALRSLSGHRRQQVWDAAAQQPAPLLLQDAPVHETPIDLPEAPEGEAVVWDYASLGLTLRSHPLALLRPLLQRRRLLSAAELQAAPDRRLARHAGIVTLRQQPETASGVVFVTLEDETGVVQVIVWRHIRERFRQVLLHARLLAVYGHWQREGEVGNLIAGYLEDLTPMLGRLLPGRSRDFH